MPVHPRHRVVHVHIPKTAGTSIGRLFRDAGDFEWNNAHWYGQVVRDGHHVELQHLTWREICDRSNHEFDDFARFATVRDPYQRLISEFHWRCAVGGDDSPLRQFATFDDLVAAIPLDLEHEWHQYASMADRWHANLLIHLRPQWHFVADVADERDRSIDIVRFEHLRAELNPLLERWLVGARPAERPHRPKPLGDYFTDESLAVVNCVYARDFDWFGYPMHSELP